MKSKVCELLAPAGNIECALAAADAGADAVYCGLGRFNARSRAENLDTEKLGSLIDFMHSKGKRVYLTFNTLLFEDELEAAGEMLADLVQLGPDALIVHDPGVIYMVRKYFPSLTLHGSTQMGIHNSAGISALAGMGVERVILERQIPVNELEKIVKRSPIEVEVFIHGSLCCSLSGRCLLSAELCGGSGNRGCCKQPCRRSFDTDEGEIFPLSMRDLNGVAILPKLREMGVASLKIEGRLRGPDYVWKCVHAYRILLDAPGGKTSPALLKEAETLLNAASARNEISAFSPEKMVDAHRIGVFGRQVGTVQNINRKGILVKASAKIHLGDRLRLVPPDGGEGMSFSLVSMEDRQKKIHSLRPGGMAFFPGAFSATPGWLIYKIGENGFDFSRQAAALPPRRLGVTLEMNVTPQLWECRIRELPGFLWQQETDFAPAENHPAEETLISEAFSSGVPAPWKVEKCCVRLGGKAFFLPGTVLKSLRRSFWEEASKALASYDPDEGKKALLSAFKDSLVPGKLSQAPAAGAQDVFEIPGFISETDLPRWKEEIAGAVQKGYRKFKAGGFHALELLKKVKDAQLCSSFPISVTNSQCAALLKELKFTAGTISPEVPEKTLSLLLERSTLPLFPSAEEVPLLVSRAKLGPEGIWKERSGTGLRLSYDEKEKLWKLWKKK